MDRMYWTWCCAAVSGLLGLGCTQDSTTCATEVPEALRTCVASYSAALAGCYETTGAQCAMDDSNLEPPLQQVEDTIEAHCEDGEWSGMTTDALVGRIRASCASESNTLSWRSYGGPHGSAVGVAEATDQACLYAAHQATTQLVDDSLAAINACLSDEACDGEDLNATRTQLENEASAAVGDSCTNLANLVAIERKTLVARASQQVDCMTATAHVDPTALGLTCGPTFAQFDPPRGEWTQIIVNGEQWGTLCGDGSDYAFQIRLAPEGEPLDRVLIGLQGGGVCVFEEDCTAKLASDPGLFNAMDDVPFSLGIVSDDPENNPFANWTRVYLPYCNQDVYAGGGVTEQLGDLELPRFGSVNIRAAIQMTRDVLWKKLDEEGGAGYRPDTFHAFFGGWSAGAYGTMYNYHWLLDDLQWPKTTAFPDAGLGLHNGSPLGVLGLGLLKIPAWEAQPNLPPYCFDGECAVGPTLFEAISPRLKQVPEQQFMVLSNPKDLTQQYDAYFDDEVLWINTLRQSYCDTKDLPGIAYYFTSVSDESVHVVTLREELWSGTVDGEVMRDWMWRGHTDPDTVQSRVEEADFVTQIPGVEPYPCEVPP